MKTCIHCKEGKELIDFKKCLRSPDGRRNVCKECIKKKKLTKVEKPKYESYDFMFINGSKLMSLYFK
jgi:hypothetical protein